MRPSRLAITLTLALASSACTVVSGVDDMELRTSSSPVAPAEGPAAPQAPATELASTGPATCGATGSWQSCSAPPALTTCAAICEAQGSACVDNCCVTDDLGDFAAKVGMVYAISLECAMPSMTSQATFGLCLDPLVLPTGFLDVRCCCK